MRWNLRSEREARITRPNQVWAADITYLPMVRGFQYLVAVMDWHSRYVLAWRLSNTLEAGFCAEALAEALGPGRPEVFNTDQGSQCTSREFIRVLEDSGVKISMDGKGRYADNIFVERLWRTVQYEEVYLGGGVLDELAHVFGEIQHHLRLGDDGGLLVQVAFRIHFLLGEFSL